MIKQFILLFQVLWIFIYQLIFSGDVTVTQKVPSVIKAGNEVLIEVVVKKNDITGFAKIQQTFPAGFSAEPVDTKGATFSYVENKIKFIWMALPAEEEFTISYKLKPEENIKGDFVVEGKFSFIAESERKNIEIPKVSFSVIENDGTEEPLVTDVVEDPVIEDPITTEDPVVEDPVVEEPVADETTINCKRTVDLIEAGKYQINVEISKKGIKGFAKITEELPAGFIASENESKSGVFSFKDKEAKILWLAIPKDEVFTISYFIEAEKTLANGDYNMKGYFSYLDNDITQKYDLPSSTVTLKREELLVEEPVIEDDPVVDVVEEPIKKDPDPIVTEKVEEEPVNNNTAKNVTSIPNPETGVSYKVQVGAGHQKVANNYFASKFNLTDGISTENHEGWVKYVVGSFNEYKLARDKRNNVRAKIKTAFVTAYNSGKRITVQEALMISNQKWYK
jgi:hypothetical protein